MKNNGEPYRHGDIVHMSGRAWRITKVTPNNDGSYSYEAVIDVPVEPRKYEVVR